MVEQGDTEVSNRGPGRINFNYADMNKTNSKDMRQPESLNI